MDDAEPGRSTEYVYRYNDSNETLFLFSMLNNEKSNVKNPKKNILEDYLYLLEVFLADSVERRTELCERVFEVDEEKEKTKGKKGFKYIYSANLLDPKQSYELGDLMKRVAPAVERSPILPS